MNPQNLSAMNPQNHNAVLYRRVSTDDQAISVAAQEARLTQYAELHHLNIMGEYCDEDVSGTLPINRRKGGAAMLRFMEQAPISHVVVAKVDRLGRNSIDLQTVANQFRSQGVALHVIDFGGSSVDTSSPIGMFMFQCLAAIAELEVGMIRERTRAAMTHKVTHGQWTGGRTAPFGFDRNGDNLVVNDTEMAWAREIFGQYRQGINRQQIAHHLNEHGVPTKEGKFGAWDSQRIKRVLDGKAIQHYLNNVVTIV